MPKARANINPELTFLLQETDKLFDSRIRPFLDEQMSKGWDIFVVKQSCGRCYYRIKTITIPDWAIKRGIAYSTWYIAHELAHSYAGALANHGPIFMAELKKICPAEYQHYEYGYKPMHAANAGLAIKREDLF